MANQCNFHKVRVQNKGNLAGCWHRGLICNIIHSYKSFFWQFKGGANLLCVIELLASSAYTGLCPGGHLKSMWSGSYYLTLESSWSSLSGPKVMARVVTRCWTLSLDPRLLAKHQAVLTLHPLTPRWSVMVAQQHIDHVFSTSYSCGLIINRWFPRGIICEAEVTGWFCTWLQKRWRITQTKYWFSDLHTVNLNRICTYPPPLFFRLSWLWEIWWMTFVFKLVFKWLTFNGCL